jgi:putative tricarboxylic transport membrane protein
VVAAFALRFGPPETFGVMLLTFSAMVGLGGKSPLKTLVAAAFGFIMAAVGIDIISGEMRMVFGTTALMGGFSFIVAVIGLFGIGEILLTVEEGLKVEGVKASVKWVDIMDTLKAIARYPRLVLQSSFVGCWLGVMPGGATPASFMAYGFAKAGAGEEMDQYGKGHVAGVLAPEAAAHGAGTCALLPMITLGIPGSPTAAVILGGLMIWGLQPGPMLFKDNPDFVWGMIASSWVANSLGLVVVVLFAPAFAAVLRTPFSILMPLLIFICAMGAYAVNNRMIDIWYMMIFGVIGYVFKKLDYTMAPMLLALVLGDMAESAMRQGMIMSQGSLWVFLRPPIALPLVLGAAIIGFWPWIGPTIKRIRGGEKKART